MERVVHAKLQGPVVLVAPTAFKGTLTPHQAARLIASAIPFARVRLCPVADGGDGTLDVLARRTRTRRVRGPLGRPVVARYARGVVEMAEASGLRRLRRPDVMRATTYGTGELIHAAGPGLVRVGMGGSATVDGGIGALEALGARFPDLRGLRAPPMEVLCDVTTRFLDAPRRFGPQKGATPAQVRRLEDRLRRIRDRVLTVYGVDLNTVEGGGAAGGLAAALWLAGATLVPGARRILELVGFEARGADLVITGEGRVDETTLAGKAVGEVIRASGRVPVGVFCGSSTLSARRLGAAWIATSPAQLAARARSTLPNPTNYPTK